MTGLLKTSQRQNLPGKGKEGAKAPQEKFALTTGDVVIDRMTVVEDV
jgi:hypothetical protein